MEVTMAANRITSFYSRQIRSYVGPSTQQLISFRRSTHGSALCSSGSNFRYTVAKVSSGHGRSHLKAVVACGISISGLAIDGPARFCCKFHYPSSPDEGLGKLTKPTKMNWEDWKTLVLIVCKRAEAIKSENKDVRKQCQSSEQKWEIIRKKCAARKVDVDSKQLRWKWDSINNEYKQIYDYIKESGSGIYFAMDRDERRKEKFPRNFPKPWYDLIDSFQKSKKKINPDCVSEAFDGIPDSVPEVPQSGSSSDEQTPESSTMNPEKEKSPHVELHSMANSGIRKRKRTNAPSPSADSEVLCGMSRGVVNIEKNKLQFLRESEAAQIEVAREHVAVIREQSTNLCRALGMLSQSLDRIATSIQKVAKHERKE